MDITVIGCGRWGSFVAWYLDHLGHQVTLYGREQSNTMQQLISTRQNQYLSLSDTVHLCTDLEESLRCDILIIAIAAQQLRGFYHTLSAYPFFGKGIVLCMKGLEIGTGKRLSTVTEESLKSPIPVAVWLGPGHSQDYYAGIPNCMVIDSQNIPLKQELVEAFSSPLIRFYYGTDLIGNEIGAATKNIIGIAAGILDGMGMPSLKGALMARGTREISKLIRALGGNAQSAYGLCHLGDYEATVFSPHSHNRKFGELFVKGLSSGKLAEGYATVKAVMDLAEIRNIELPICTAVHHLLYEQGDAETELKELFLRSSKEEFL